MLPMIACSQCTTQGSVNSMLTSTADPGADG
jgi:hypothetical protein